jgi:hypothetical protein
MIRVRPGKIRRGVGDVKCLGETFIEIVFGGNKLFTKIRVFCNDTLFFVSHLGEYRISKFSPQIQDTLIDVDDLSRPRGQLVKLQECISIDAANYQKHGGAASPNSPTLPDRPSEALTICGQIAKPGLKTIILRGKMVGEERTEVSSRNWEVSAAWNFDHTRVFEKEAL